MSGEERRNRILKILTTADQPVSGTRLAGELSVSRQVIVQDIALLRVAGNDIFSTNKGYLIRESREYSRVFKVIHSDEDAEREMNMIVDMGGRLEDVFVYHKVYGVLHAQLRIRSRKDIREYLEELAGGRSSLLKNVTGGYHYHTVVADSEKTLDQIQEELQKMGFLAPLQDYEPVDFWKKDSQDS